MTWDIGALVKTEYGDYGHIEACVTADCVLVRINGRIKQCDTETLTIIDTND